MDKAKVLKQVLSEYKDYMENSQEISRLYGLVKGGRATQAAGLQMASLSGGKLADIFVENILPELGEGEALLLDDALAVIPEGLKSNYEYVTAFLLQLQTKLDAKAGIGLKPLTAPFDIDRARGLAEVATEGAFADIAQNFKGQVANYAMHVVDESMQMTAESRAHAGLEVLVTRTYDDVGLSGGRECEWCKERECHDMPYQEAYELGAFERHPGCGCMITYTNSKGDTTYQAGKGVWYKSSKEALEQRKSYGL